MKDVWTADYFPRKDFWRTIAYGDGVFVAIARDNTTFLHSNNGIDWIETITGLNVEGEWEFVTYGNGMFVAICGDTYGYRNTAYSYNGIDWTEGGTLPGPEYWNGVFYVKDRFIALSKSDAVFAYSYDGITWIEGALLPESKYWVSVAYGNGKFVAVKGNATVTETTGAFNKFAYSDDGINWLEGDMPSTQYWASVVYGDGKFVANIDRRMAISDQTKTIFAYSDDGITWFEKESNLLYSWISIIYANKQFIAVFSNTNKFAYSYDGITWIEGDMPSTQVWTYIVYGDGKFISIVNNSNQFAYMEVEDASALNIEYLKLEVGKKATENIPDVKQSASNIDVLSDKFTNRDLLNVLEELKDTEISTGQIANGAVTLEKIADGVLTAENTSVAGAYTLPSGQAKNVENLLSYLNANKENRQWMIDNWKIPSNKPSTYPHKSTTIFATGSGAWGQEVYLITTEMYDSNLIKQSKMSIQSKKTEIRYGMQSQDTWTEWETEATQNWTTETFSNPNLLINTNFKNLVNTSGLSAWSPEINQTIDCFDLWTVKNNITKNTLYENKDIDIYIGIAEGGFVDLEPKVIPDFETITISMDVNNHVYSKTLNNGGNGALVPDYIDIHTTIERPFIIRIKKSISINWVKVEYGTTNTKYIPKPYVEELQNSMMYNESGEVINPLEAKNHSIEDINNNFTSTNVEGALAELAEGGKVETATLVINETLIGATEPTTGTFKFYKTGKVVQVIMNIDLVGIYSGNTILTKAEIPIGFRPRANCSCLADFMLYAISVSVIQEPVYIWLDNDGGISFTTAYREEMGDAMGMYSLSFTYICE